MMSRRQLERYRAMTPGERLALSLEMTSGNEPALWEGGEEMVARKFRWLRTSHELSTSRLLAAFARLKEADGTRQDSAG
jgi:hypothetical protein